MGEPSIRLRGAPIKNFEKLQIIAARDCLTDRRMESGRLPTLSGSEEPSIRDC